jgi:hypothetical protein
MSQTTDKKIYKIIRECLILDKRSEIVKIGEDYNIKTGFLLKSQIKRLNEHGLTIKSVFVGNSGHGLSVDVGKIEQ